MGGTKSESVVRVNELDLKLDESKWNNKDSCERCQKRFWLFRRRHHCRLCASSCCEDCVSPSGKVSDLLGPHLVCKTCADKLKSESAESKESKESKDSKESSSFAVSGDAQTLVLVSGATGFVAGHIIKKLLKAGYSVRGTVRSLAKTEKYKHLTEMGDEAGEGRLELVEADLMKAESWEAAVKGCRYVIHTASPFPIAVPKDENELIRPAVDGTLSVLRAVANYNTNNPNARIERVVMTSSQSSISEGYEKDESKRHHVYDESDWSVTDKSTPYAKSKTLAEEAAWKFVKDTTDAQKFELVCIHPTYIQGPLLSTSGGEGSATIVRRLLANETPALPEMSLGIVDVRDVAEAHMRAMVSPNAAGKRYLVSNCTVWYAEIAKILRDNFGPKGFKVASMKAPFPLLWTLSFWDADVEAILPIIGRFQRFNTAAVKRDLGLEFTPLLDTFISMSESMIKLGMVKA